MLEIKNTKVQDLYESIIRAGYPMDLGDLVDNFDDEVRFLKYYIKNKGNEENVKDLEMFNRGKAHYNRAVKLGNVPSGSGHNNYQKAIRVSFDLKYPEYISPQLQRYNWFDISSSQSKMHRLTKMDVKNSCNKYVDSDVIENLNRWIDAYNNFPKDNNYYYSTKTGEYAGHLDDNCNYAEMYGSLLSKYEVFMKIISNCPMGLEKWMGISTNYMQLKTIYKQRKLHKLKQDYKVLCDWIENLPLFKQICLGVDD